MSAALMLAATLSAPLPSGWTPAQYDDAVRFEVASQGTGQRYRISVALPHAPAPKEGYPTLWVLDGDAAFPMMQPFRPRTPDQLASRPGHPSTDTPGLIVAIGFASGAPFDIDGRAYAYTPDPKGPSGDQLSTRHGGEAAFRHFLVDELRPLLAKQFPLDPNRNTLFGFSYGGLFTLNTLLDQPDAFQRYWAASPSLWFGGSQSMKNLSERVRALPEGFKAKVNISVGLDEQFPEQFASAAERRKLAERTMVDNVRAFAKALGQRPTVEVTTQELAGRNHMDMLQHGTREVVRFAFRPERNAK
ncbi:alpha/beta hydrolase [Chitinibacteraceae bacterium HSL-7]